LLFKRSQKVARLSPSKHDRAVMNLVEEKGSSLRNMSVAIWISLV
jgi:hypothetical protein